MTKFKVGDRVRMRDDVTYEDLNELCIGYTADLIRSGGDGTVVGCFVFEDAISVEFPAVGMSLIYDAGMLEVVND